MTSYERIELLEGERFASPCIVIEEVYMPGSGAPTWTPGYPAWTFSIMYEPSLYREVFLFDARPDPVRDLEVCIQQALVAGVILRLPVYAGGRLIQPVGS